MNIAVCFFGQVKNFDDKLYESFQKVIRPTQSNKVCYYIVTYNNKIYTNTSSGENHQIDYRSIFKYFTFRNEIILDAHSHQILQVDNFVRNELKKYGYAKIWGENAQELTINAVRQIYGLNELYRTINKNYDKYLLCRPDCVFENDLDENLMQKKCNICIPNFNHWFGYNDRFAIVDKIGLETYCGRFDLLKKNPQNYHSEMYLKQTIHNSKNTIYLFDNFRFRLLRANGQLSSPNY